jgi:hypothetical protein
MRLYTFCKTSPPHKFYIYSHAKMRYELASSFYLTCPYNHTHIYYPNEVYAEETEINTGLGGALAGGLIGLLAGGIGAIIGVLTGGALGINREKQDKELVNRFNNST